MVGLDQRGVILTCANCGQRNRVRFDRLRERARCGKCSTEMRPVSEPVVIETEEQFDGLIQGSALAVLVDFWAEWCGPCKMLAPELVKVAGEMAGEVLIAKVDTERVPALANRFGISSIPTLLLFSGGHQVAGTAGAQPASALKAFLARSLTEASA